MYPKIVTIENDKLRKLMLLKGELVDQGRAISDQIETLEKEMAETDTALQAEEKKVNIDDLLEKEKAISLAVDQAIKDMQAIKQEIFDRMTAQVPPEFRTKYDELKKQKEDLEAKRNKIALKAHKYNDKIVPLGREMMKPFLKDMYEDYETLYLDGDQIVATIFSHMNDFKTNFKKK